MSHYIIQSGDGYYWTGEYWTCEIEAAKVYGDADVPRTIADPWLLHAPLLELRENHYYRPRSVQCTTDGPVASIVEVQLVVTQTVWCNHEESDSHES